LTQDQEEAAAVIRTAVNLIRLYAVTDLNLLTAGRTFQAPPVPIQKIEDNRVAEQKAHYGGD
jgi:methionyl-tRNA synthetase